MRILVADDDPVYRSLVEGLLREWHFEPVLAADGAEAWRILQHDDPVCLVLLDWMMPGMDGFEVCKRIRREGRLGNTYILIMTGSRKKEDILKVVVAGADDYLIKPFDPVDLKIRLRNAMRMLHLQEELAELRRALHQESTRAASC